MAEEEEGATVQTRFCTRSTLRLSALLASQGGVEGKEVSTSDVMNVMA